MIDSEHLAVAINASMFDSNFGWRPRWWPRMPGDLANSVETVVANHVVAYGPFNTSLLWFDDALVPQRREHAAPAPTGYEAFSPFFRAIWLGEVGFNGLIRGGPDYKVRPAHRELPRLSS